MKMNSYKTQKSQNKNFLVRLQLHESIREEFAQLLEEHGMEEFSELDREMFKTPTGHC